MAEEKKTDWRVIGAGVSIKLEKAGVWLIRLEEIQRVESSGKKTFTLAKTFGGFAAVPMPPDDARDVRASVQLSEYKSPEERKAIRDAETKGK